MPMPSPAGVPATGLHATGRFSGSGVAYYSVNMKLKIIYYINIINIILICYKYDVLIINIIANFC